MKFRNYITLSVLILLLNTIIIEAQQSSKTMREHQAVQSFFNQMKSKSKANSSVEQSSFKDKNDAVSLSKIQGNEDRKSYLMNGNRITVQVTNYGGIAPGFGLIRNVNNFVWNDLGYLFTFGPVIGAEVVDEKGDTVHIISDGLNDYASYGLQELSPSRDTLWQWQPLAGYADPDQPNMASNPAVDADGDGKPDSWPRSWYNETLGKYVWPGFLSQDATNADLEVYWAMDDRDNLEFDYYPFNDSRRKKGLGIQIDGRAFQWSNALAENTIFFVYTVTNVSDKRLDKVFFGLYGDPDLGGSSAGGENSDDRGLFIPPYSLDSVDVDNVPVYSRSMVYLFDDDMVGNFGLPLGYLGCKFLESPGNAENHIDDDGDGMTDESQQDDIDNDGDWNPNLDDVGIDGIPGTDDVGEGDGVPTAGLAQADGSPHPLYPGEPNFEFTDLDESDQIGLTSFNSWTWSSGGGVNDDELMWSRNIPGNFSDVASFTDLVFIFGSGYISLNPGETKRISMALLVGEDLDDLLTTAEVVQTIYNENYQFYKPPVQPTVTAVPDDKKVTLYWDTAAEESIDPLTGKDFEGYVIYRSTDPSFSDIQVITDGKGSKFLNEPLKDLDGNEAKFDVAIRDEPFDDLNGNGVYDADEPFTDWNNDLAWTPDVEDYWQGYHPVPYQKRGLHYYLGNNTGLVHSYVDSNNVINGQTYYYAVVSYDHGDTLKIPVSESTRNITLDPITNKLTFDQNTVQVIPGPRASGFTKPTLAEQDIEHTQGIGTGQIIYEIMDELDIEDGAEFRISFSDSLGTNGDKIADKNYSVLSLDELTDSATLYEYKYTNLRRSGIAEDDVFVVTDASGTPYVKNVDYEVNFARGAIKRIEGTSIGEQEKVYLTYRYYPIFQSTLLNNEDSNPVFHGVKLSVIDEEALVWDQENTVWTNGESNYRISAKLSSVGANKRLYPGDYEIEISDELIDSAITFSGGVLKIPVNYTVHEVSRGVPEKMITFLSEQPGTRNLLWDPGESIVIFAPGSTGDVNDVLTWEVVVSTPTDSTITPIPPKSGDALIVKTKRPFNNEDAFVLTTKAGTYENEKAADRLKDIYVVPNPYVGYNDIEPVNPLPGQSRGERRIYFENLPSECTIRIYTLSGDPVKKIDHYSGLENGREYWNLLNEDGFSVAYGVYVAHIDAPNVGERILKFALIK